MRIQLRDEIFGEMLPYIRDDDVTDVNWNGSALWINSLTRGRYMDESVKLDEHFVEQFSNRIANLVNQNFNMSPRCLKQRQTRCVCPSFTMRWRRPGSPFPSEKHPRSGG